MRLLLPVLFLAVTAGAQVRESVTVELIEVPVYVTVDGKPLRNIPREAFELRVNGKKQPVEYFDALDFATPPAHTAETTIAAPAAAPNLRARRLYTRSKQLAFDEASRTPSGWVTLRETFDLPPGTYAAKALLRIAGTGVLGFSRNDFTIGE